MGPLRGGAVGCGPALWVMAQGQVMDGWMRSSRSAHQQLQQQNLLMKHPRAELAVSGERETHIGGRQMN